MESVLANVIMFNSSTLEYCVTRERPELFCRFFISKVFDIRADLDIHVSTLNYQRYFEDSSSSELGFMSFQPVSESDLKNV